MTGPRKLAQFSFIGFAPSLLLNVKDGKVTLHDLKYDERINMESRDPIQVIKAILGAKSENCDFRFVGGAVGYVSYDAIRYWEKIPKIALDDLGFPDFQMGIYSDGLIFDHLGGETLYFFRGEDRSSELSKLAKKAHNPGSLSYTDPKANIKQSQYGRLVEKAKFYIASGDIFQVVLSKRYDFKIEGDLARFYVTLKKINPSPYMYFLKMGERKIIGSSPEMLVRVEGDTIETFPIAGTRPRVENPAENRALARNLLSDPKERAEHVMLVDLARNDIGKVSKFGSVQVREFMKVHQYSHVQHIVSRVSGKLMENRDSYDVLRAVFPAGTVSGAPKVRAMEIIEESEPVRRGPYAGAVGYFSFNGNADFAITIRTLVVDGARAFIQAGGGIVADSIPQNEWFETEHKAKALINALKLAEEQK